MAIGTTPLFSKISGSAGPIDFRTRRNGKIEIGKKRIPANPQSTEQQNTRNAYGQLHELWQNAAWIDKTQYENIAAAYNISPWNAFLMRHLPMMRLNPVAYWPFVEGAGNTLHDFTANENHGTISGSTWTPYDIYDAPSLFFDGVDDHVDCGNDASLDITAAITIDTWVKLSAIGTIQDILNKRAVLGNMQYYLRTLDDNTIEFGTYNGAYHAVKSISTFTSTSKYNHLTGVFTGTKYLIYLNGVLDNTNVDNTILATTIGKLSIGRKGEADANYYNGFDNHTAIYNYDLTADKIKNIHEKTRKFYGV